MRSQRAALAAEFVSTAADLKTVQMPRVARTSDAERRSLA
jgi:hypothetical protein